MRPQIYALLLQGKTYSQIVAELGCAKSTVAYHAKNVKEPPSYKVHDWDAVQKFYDEGHGVNECRRTFGICAAVWYGARKQGKIVTRQDHRIPVEVLMQAGRGTIRSHLKARLIRDGLLEEKCAECGIMSWRDKPLALELHHINGVNNDNRLDNLQLLCPNCHSQTPTYGGRNANRMIKESAG